jgi:hypothetical protein
MLALLISIMMSLGIHFTDLKDGKIQVSSSDMEVLKASDEFQKSGIGSLESVIIADDISPTNDAQSKD